MSCEYVGIIASGIWNDIGSPTSITISAISGRLLTSGFLGQLDAINQTCHFIDSGCIYPLLVGEEIAIYEEIYKANYYRTFSTQEIGNI